MDDAQRVAHDALVESLASNAIGRTRRRLATHLFHGGLSALAASLVLQMLGTARSGQPVAMVIAVLGACLFASSAALVVAGRRRLPGEIGVSHEVVRVTRKGEPTRLHPRDTFESGYVEVEGGRTIAVLTTERERFEVDVDVPERADGLLSAVGLDPRRRLVRFARRESGSAVTRSFVAFCAVVVSWLAVGWLLDEQGRAAANRALLVLTTTLLGIGLGTAVSDKFEPSPVEVGADGVRWMGWFGHKHALTSTGTNEQRELARKRAAVLSKSVADPQLAAAFVEVARDRLAPRSAEQVGDG